MGWGRVYMVTSPLCGRGRSEGSGEGDMTLKKLQMTLRTALPLTRPLGDLSHRGRGDGATMFYCERGNDDFVLFQYVIY